MGAQRLGGADWGPQGHTAVGGGQWSKGFGRGSNDIIWSSGGDVLLVCLDNEDRVEGYPAVCSLACPALGYSLKAPEGMRSYCTCAQEAISTKVQKQIWPVSGLQDHGYVSVTRVRHTDASGQATNTQSNGAQRNVKDRRQAATIGPVSQTSN